MTIVYCIESLAQPGGMERVLTVKANYLAGEAGHTVHVVVRFGDGEPAFPLSPRVRVHRMGPHYKEQLSALLMTLRPDITVSLYGEECRWLYTIRDGSAKVLEFHFTRNHLVHLVKGLPNVNFRGLRVQYARLLQYLDERWARHYDRLVLLTEADRQLWGSPANAVVIPNPLSFTSARCSDLRQKRILSAGRLIATKGFDLLIDAFRLAVVDHPDWTLTILGEGQDKGFLQDRIRRHRLEEQVEILPPTPYIIRELLNSSIYAAASRYEGFGLMITEAMECGIPCVAFDCECGPREIIRDGSDGFLVEPQNTDKFAETLYLLMGSSPLRERLGRQAKLSAGRFALPAIMQRWEELFHTLTESRTTYA